MGTPNEGSDVSAISAQENERTGIEIVPETYSNFILAMCSYSQARLGGNVLFAQIHIFLWA